MHKANLYSRSNGMQRLDAKETIDEFMHKIQWRKDGWDSVIDIGCGTADVLWDFLLPNLPDTFQRVVGVDQSEEMIEYAEKQYSNPRVSFKKLDIGIDISFQDFRYEPFDHATSFYCLNWVTNQKCAVRNLYKLLKPGGDMLLGLLAQNPIYDIYKEMAENSEWSGYMRDVDNFVSPYHYSQSPADDFRKLLSTNGFAENWVEVRERNYVFEGIDALRNAWEAVDPWYDQIPAHKQDDYWNCFLDCCIRGGYCTDECRKNTTSCHVRVPYKWMIAWAKSS